MLIQSTADNAIQLHDDHGLLCCETEYDEQVLIDGRWWEVDLFTGEILSEVVGH